MYRQKLIKAIENHSGLEVTTVRSEQFRIDLFDFGKYSLSLIRSGYLFINSAYLFKDGEEISSMFFQKPEWYSETVPLVITHLLEKHVEKFVDHVSINDMAETGYLGNDVWLVKVLDEAPFSHFDTDGAAFYLCDTLEELDNQDLFDYEPLDADYEDNLSLWAEISCDRLLETCNE